MNLELNDLELHALFRALNFIKFKSEEYDAKELSGSPYVAELYKKVGDATAVYYRSTGEHVLDAWPFIETIPRYLDVVKIRIKDTRNWNQLENDTREAFIKTLVYPYRISEKTITELTRYGSEIHARIDEQPG